MRIIYLLFLFSIGYFGQSQVNSNSLVSLHAVANVTQMNAISNPVTGIAVFNSENNTIYVYNGAIWVQQLETRVETPNLAIYEPLQIRKGTTAELIISGYNFTKNTQLNIASEAGNLVSFTVESPTLIKASFIASNNVGFYDIEVIDDQKSNTSWAGNATNKLEVWDFDGTQKQKAATSCKAILDNGYTTGDGNYWINPTGGTAEDDAFEVYCDMTTEGGGWTRVEYTNDLYMNNNWSGGDARRWLPDNFKLHFSDARINAIRAVSTEAKQKYVGYCDGVIHYYYNSSKNYIYSFGFRFHTGAQTSYGTASYPNTNITILTDGCKANSGTNPDTNFLIRDIRLPVINVNTRDSGNGSERFGSPLTENPVWFR